MNRGLLKFDPKVTLRPPGIKPRAKANPWKGFMLPLHQGRAVISCAQYAEMQYYNLNLISIHLCDYSTAGMGLGFYSDQRVDEDGLDAQFFWEEAAPRNVTASVPKSEGGEVRRRAGPMQESRLAVSRPYYDGAIALRSCRGFSYPWYLVNIGRFLFADPCCSQFTLSELSRHKVGTCLTASGGGKVLSEVGRGLRH